MQAFDFAIEHKGTEYSFSVESVYNDILNEVYYSVQLFDYPPFVMAYDFDTARFRRQGKVHYIILELEEQISERIEKYNLGIM